MSRPHGDGPESDCTGLRIHVYICEKWTGDLTERVLSKTSQSIQLISQNRGNDARLVLHL